MMFLNGTIQSIIDRFGTARPEWAGERFVPLISLNLLGFRMKILQRHP